MQIQGSHIRGLHDDGALCLKRWWLEKWRYLLGQSWDVSGVSNEKSQYQGQGILFPGLKNCHHHGLLINSWIFVPNGFCRSSILYPQPIFGLFFLFHQPEFERSICFVLPTQRNRISLQAIREFSQSLCKTSLLLISSASSWFLQSWHPACFEPGRAASLNQTLVSQVPPATRYSRRQNKTRSRVDDPPLHAGIHQSTQS